MRVHYLQHVPFEGLGSIENTLKDKGCSITLTQFFKKEYFLPDTASFDCLIIMGGPMNIYQQDLYPWLRDEKVFIKEAIDAKKVVIGICLGAQLIADVLGAKVYKNKYREIGWFPVRTDKQLKTTNLSKAFPSEFFAFHWHGDTFDIPQGAFSIGETSACKNQGFIFQNHVVALQFHLETTKESIVALVENCRDELDGSLYVHSENEILVDQKYFLQAQDIINRLLDVLLIAERK